MYDIGGWAYLEFCLNINYNDPCHRIRMKTCMDAESIVENSWDFETYGGTKR